MWITLYSTCFIFFITFSPLLDPRRDVVQPVADVTNLVPTHLPLLPSFTRSLPPTPLSLSPSSTRENQLWTPANARLPQKSRHEAPRFRQDERQPTSDQQGHCAPGKRRTSGNRWKQACGTEKGPATARWLLPEVRFYFFHAII